LHDVLLVVGIITDKQGVQQFKTGSDNQMARSEMNFLKSRGYKSQNSAYDLLTNEADVNQK
jgi:hypothetical protein